MIQIRVTHFFRSVPCSTWLLLLSAGALYWLLLVHQPSILDATQPLLAWLIGLVLFLSCCWQLDREQGTAVPLNLVWHRRDTLVLATVCVVGFALRAIYLDHIPLAMHNDEAAMAMEAVHVLDGSLRDPFAVGWYSHPTLWFYLMSLGLRLFGATLVGARVCSVLVGVFAVGATYGMARLFYGWRVAMLAAFLLATYHFHLHFSRIALNNIVDSALGPLLCSCLFIALHTRRSLFYGLTGVVAGFSLYFYMGGRLFILFLLVAGAAWLLAHRQLWPQWRRPAQWWPILLIIAGFCFVAGPLLQTLARDPTGFFVRTKVVMLTPAWVAEVLHRKQWTLAQFVWAQLQSPLLLFYNRTEAMDFYDRQRPLLQGSGTLLVVLGLGVASWRGRQWRYQILLLWLGLALFFGGVLMRVPLATPRYVILAPVVCSLMAIALDAGWHKARAVWPQGKIVLNLAVGLLVCYLAGASIYQYFFDYIPRETFGNTSSEAATLLGRYLQTQPLNTQVWLMGDRWFSYQGFPILTYYAPTVAGHDWPKSFQTMADLPTPTPQQTNLYVAVPARVPELALIQRRWPGGLWRPLYWPLRPQAPLLYLYQLAPHQSH